MIRWKPVWVGALAVCVVVVGASCTSGRGGGDTEPLPSLKDIRSRLETKRELDSEPPPLFAVLRVVEISLPLETPTQPAWDKTTQGGFNPSVVDAWSANGMRLGVLNAGDWSEFLQSLQGVTGQRQTRVRVSQQRVRVLTSPVYGGGVSFEVVGVGGAAQTHRFAKGRCQLLGRVVEQPGGGVSLELVPHYFQRRVTLGLRSPGERALDGVVFDWLSVGVRLPTAGVLVVGLDPRTGWAQAYRPAELIDTSVEGSPPAAVPETQPEEEEQPLEAPKARRVLRDGLGARLFAVSRLGKPTQIVVVIAVYLPGADSGVGGLGKNEDQ